MLNKTYSSLVLGTGVALLSACSTTQQQDPAPVVEAPPPVVTQPVDPLPPVQPAQPVTPGFSQQEQYLLSQSPSAYTIQVLGAHSTETVDKFINRFPGYNFMQIQSSLNGQPWHVLFYGVYNSQNEARRALSALPSSIRQNSPWVRQVRGVQDQISSGRVR